MTKSQQTELKTKGFTILRNIVSESWTYQLRTAIDKSFLEHRKIQSENGNEINTDGVALHVLLTDPIFIDFLAHLQSIGLFESLEKYFFKSKCILNSFSALNNIPNAPNFSAKVHRDLRFYSGDFPVMVNCLVMVDDFTIENGGTYLLPESHLKQEQPSDKLFLYDAIQATGKKGDILIFNSNVFHASAPNKTTDDRRAIPITVCRSFMKQLLDYPRAIGYEKMTNFNLEMQQFLGYHSRVPASLHEWYQPEENRFYKKNQD